MVFDIAYLSQGKLYLKQGDRPVREIESEFGRSLQQRRLQMERRKAWRDRSIRSMTLTPQMAKQMEQQSEVLTPVAITSLCQLTEGEFLYALESEDMGGLFRFEPDRDRENRLFHSTDFRIGHLNFSADHNQIACTKNYPTGITNLATLAANAVRPQDITAGDSVDLAPCWLPGQQKALVYQSAGVGRNEQGYVVNRAPFTIEKLDFEQQDIISMAADPKSDLLGPQVSAEGWLYYIRRPYRSYQTPVGLGQFFKDVLLIPLRLLEAIFGFFNAFTQLFTGKPLMTAGNQQKVERKFLRTLGGWVTPENLSKENAAETDAPNLVPASWQLVRQAAQGVPEVLAKHVLAFDLMADGTVLYTNGSSVHQITPAGKREKLFVGKYIEAVRGLPRSPEVASEA
ncbi:MAG: hypothetical protein F6J87_13525 [Spirulina sp. SIO3F2]|nr:hypothetical protein [Spirulina sp. SIO3F2]